jgi:hypothetical protein
MKSNQHDHERKNLIKTTAEVSSQRIYLDLVIDYLTTMFAAQIIIPSKGRMMHEYWTGKDVKEQAAAWII